MGLKSIPRPLLCPQPFAMVNLKCDELHHDIMGYLSRFAAGRNDAAGAAAVTGGPVSGCTLRLSIRRSEDFLVRLNKSPDGRMLIPELDDFEVVNRSIRWVSGN